MVKPVVSAMNAWTWYGVVIGTEETKELMGRQHRHVRVRHCHSFRHRVAIQGTRCTLLLTTLLFCST